MYDKCKAGVGLCLILGATLISGWFILGGILFVLALFLGVGRHFYRRGQNGSNQDVNQDSDDE